MKPGLSIALEQNGDKRILRLSGCLDAQTLSSFEQQLDSLFEKLHFKLLLDFTQLETVTDAALELLFSKTKKFKEVKGRLGLIGINDALLQTIKSADLDRFLLIYPNELEALKAMAC